MEGLSKEQFRAVLAQAKAHSERDWLMMLVHFWHGARASELVGGWAIKGPKGKKVRYLHPGLTSDNIQGDYLVFDRLKGSEPCKQKLVTHPDPLFDERKALFAFARKTPRKQRLFKLSRSQYWRNVRGYCLEVGVPQHLARTTVLKHTLGTLLIENMPINKVQRRMGHVSMGSTGKYMKAKESDVDRLVVGAAAL
jgi:site-specific recombinase XerD